MEEIRIIGPYEPVVYRDGAEPSLCATNLNRSENYLKELSEDFLEFSKNTSNTLDDIKETRIPAAIAEAKNDATDKANAAEEAAKGYTDTKHADAITHTDEQFSDAKDYVDEKYSDAVNYTNQEVLTLSNTVDSNKSLFDAHESATNPHRITKDMVGLDNVENYSSEQLRNLFTGSIDTSTEGFITLKDALYILSQLQVHQNNRDNPHEVSAEQVGLGNVENKSVSEIKEDLEGPVSETSNGFVRGSNVYGFVKQLIEETEASFAEVTSSLISAVQNNAEATSSNAQKIQYNSDEIQSNSEKIEQNTTSITTNSSNIAQNSTRIEEVYSAIPTKMSQLENDGGYLTSSDLGDDLIFNCGTSR